MKKLMIAAAIVCAAVASQAANFSWGFASGSDVDPAGEWMESGTASLYINNVLIATAGQNEDFQFGVFDNPAVDTTGNVQTLGRGDISESFVGQAYKLVFSYTDADGKDWEFTYTATSDYSTVPGPAGEDAFNYESFVTDYAVRAGDWKAVPEPTSSLLLLLGVGALALRRRRA